MTYVTAAAVLREARRLSGRSQRDLAAAAGTAQSVVGRIEAGTASPSLETLGRLVAAAGYELRLELVPAPQVDPVIEAYKPGVDQTLLVENLRRSVEERLRINTEMAYFTDELRKSHLRRVAEGSP